MQYRTSVDDYDKHCNLDVLGVQDVQESHEDSVHNNFKQQLRQSTEGWYESIAKKVFQRTQQGV